MANRVVTEIVSIPKPISFKEAKAAVLRVAAYARVSTNHEEQQTSLAAQTEYYQKLIKERPGWSFVKIYADDGVSGLDTRHRIGFTSMIEDCLAGLVDLILTKSISRFARNTVDSVSVIRKLKEKGVGVYFEKENIYTLDSKGEFLLTIMSSLAQEESRSISENVRWGQRKRFADGKSSLPCKRFLGYDQGDEKYQIVVNKEQAVIVRRIFFLFLQGYSTHKIANLLTAEGILSPGGCDKWYQGTVESILQNEKYKGDALLQKQFTLNYLTKKMKKNEGELPQYYVKEDHEAIISPWLFDYVQEQIAVRSNSTAKFNGMTLWSSKIVCGVCGNGYAPRPWHSTTYNNLVWQCRNRVSKGTKSCGQNIYDKLLHYIIHDAARKEIDNRDMVQIILTIVVSTIPAAKKGTVVQWLKKLGKQDVWKMISDENDLAIAIRRLLVKPGGKMNIEWLDGTRMVYRIPKYTPKGGIRHDDQ